MSSQDRSQPNRALELAFATLLSRLDPEHAVPLARAAELLIRARREGHSCVLPEHCEELTGGAGELFGLASELRSSHLVGEGQPDRPLVLDAADRLYLQRYWKLEQDIATRILERTQAAPRLTDESAGRQALDRVSPPGDLSEEQRSAALKALRVPFSLITGGPGTGKTTLLLRILAALQVLHEGRLRIQLAAPTGKAAARMTEALRQGMERLDLDSGLRATLNLEAVTIHRLLRQGAAGLQRCDLLVVDEASMIDLELMHRLLGKLPSASGLILLGDPDQLASVEAGSVLADLVSGLESRSRVSPVSRLSVSRRFPADKPLGHLASALRAGDAGTALDLLEQGHQDLLWEADPGRAKATILEQLLPDLRVLASCTDPVKAFALMEQHRLLCALRRSPYGVEAMNRLLEHHLSAGNGSGRPILIRRNDPALGLANGDSGFLMGDGPGAKSWFPDSRDGAGLRELPVALLPEWDTAWAITVHQSQGSEFGRVSVLLPDRDNPLLARELLYTAVTRARHGIRLLASAEILKACINRQTRRGSGLAARLVATRLS